MTAQPNGADSALVAAAAAGDREAFSRLVEPIYRELHLFCYRMLGSVEDAEDVLQEAQIKAWSAIARFEHRSSFRAWMYRIVTNASLDALRSRRRRLLPPDLGPPADPALGLGDPTRDGAWLEPYVETLPAASDPHAAAELRESVRLAFVRALQLLPPRQRAVLILRDVLGWSSAEVASTLGTSVHAVTSALQRARTTVANRHVPGSPSRRPDGHDGNTAGIAARYVAAWEAGDMDAIVAMLADDIVQAMPPWPSWYVGRDALRTLYSGYAVWNGAPGPGVFRVIPLLLNGDLAFAEYCRSVPDGPYDALALTVMSLGPGASRIAEKVSFVRADLLTRLGLPASLR